MAKGHGLNSCYLAIYYATLSIVWLSLAVYASLFYETYEENCSATCPLVTLDVAYVNEKIAAGDQRVIDFYGGATYNNDPINTVSSKFCYRSGAICLKKPETDGQLRNQCEVYSEIYNLTAADAWKYKCLICDETNNSRVLWPSLTTSLESFWNVAQPCGEVSTVPGIPETDIPTALFPDMPIDSRQEKGYFRYPFGVGDYTMCYNFDEPSDFWITVAKLSLKISIYIYFINSTLGLLSAAILATFHKVLLSDWNRLSLPKQCASYLLTIMMKLLKISWLIGFCVSFIALGTNGLDKTCVFQETELGSVDVYPKAEAFCWASFISYLLVLIYRNFRRQDIFMYIPYELSPVESDDKCDCESFYRVFLQPCFVYFDKYVGP